MEKIYKANPMDLQLNSRRKTNTKKTNTYTLIKPVFCFWLSLIAIPFMGAQTELPNSGSEVSGSDSPNCLPLVINSVSHTHATECGAVDGTLTIELEDENPARSTYRVELLFDQKAKTVTGLSGTILQLEGLAPGDYYSIVVTREGDGCASNNYSRNHTIEPGCDWAAMHPRSCTSGTSSATSCITGSTVSHPSTDLTPNTITALHDGWAPNCITEVDNNCDFVNPQLGFCLDYDRAGPNHFVIYTKQFGLDNSGISNLEAGRLAWLFANTAAQGLSSHHRIVQYGDHSTGRLDYSWEYHQRR